ncbi:hypothetical protein GCM10007852_35680 [Agaribacter marinus]|uniref:Uncharacterized protein n=2 Tax=Agaribacter marinus TaxID=1431249 RepID=A0AA37T2B2_9ALTE|nr:hypothetical protein GCM10007852_35680 [Agaribacter marinus]
MSEPVTTYIRYQTDGKVSYGILEGETIHELNGDIFGSHRRTGKKVPIEKVSILPPTDAQKVIAVGHNFQSHIEGMPTPKEPVLFAKLLTSLIGHDSEVRYFSDTTDLHFEGEMVLVIGKTASNVSLENASNYIFAVAPGNDISERHWQQNDVQWFRGKSSDTFGPVGPVMVRGADYNNLLVQTRVNGKVMQSQSTKDMIFSPEQIVSYVSRYVTLEPGDLIFSGTPGKTSAMLPGDVVEIELEGVGVLRNTIGDKEEPQRLLKAK